MGVNRERLLGDIRALGAIGFQAGTGTTRPAYSEAFREGQAYVIRSMEAAGLEVFVDAVGNVSGRLPGESEKIIALGSHIDSVPGGGMYDGAYGVLAALECLRTWQEEGRRNRHTLEVLAFTEEEGNVIGGTFGSKCFAGVALDEAMREPMARQGITPALVAAARRDPQDYRGYLELHIEQGGQLVAAQKQIGIVEGIVGILRYQAVVKGEENHAGSTPMALRRDALKTSCQIILRLMSLAEQVDGLTATVGTMTVAPGAVNVIPGRVEFIIELRYREMTAMERIIAQLEGEFGAQGLSLKEFIRQEETACAPELLSLLADCCDDLGFSRQRMFSGAGHDLINLATFTPSALLFIPSQGGISHSIREYSTDEAVEQGAQLLYEALKRLDEKGE